MIMASSIISTGSFSLSRVSSLSSKESVDETESNRSMSTTSCVLRARNEMLLCSDPALWEAREKLLDAIDYKRQTIMSIIDSADNMDILDRKKLRHSEEIKKLFVRARKEELTKLRSILQTYNDTEKAIQLQEICFDKNNHAIQPGKLKTKQDIVWIKDAGENAFRQAPNKDMKTYLMQKPYDTGVMYKFLKSVENENIILPNPDVESIKELERREVYRQSSFHYTEKILKTIQNWPGKCMRDENELQAGSDNTDFNNTEEELVKSLHDWFNNFLEVKAKLRKEHEHLRDLSPSTLAKAETYIANKEMVNKLLLNLSGQIERKNNVLQKMLKKTNSNEKEIEQKKRTKYLEQYEEAKILQAFIDERGLKLFAFLKNNLSEKEFEVYKYFIEKSLQLTLNSQELEYRINRNRENIFFLTKENYKTTPD